jgi:hypothetical protein
MEARRMDRWDILIAGAAAYIAVTSLVRLMRDRHNRLVAHLREQIASQRPTQQTKPADKKDAA